MSPAAYETNMVICYRVIHLLSILLIDRIQTFFIQTKALKYFSQIFDYRWMQFGLSLSYNLSRSIIMAEKDSGVPQIKLIAVGDSGVGKSSILTRFTSNKFDEFSEPTLGAAFIPKKFSLPDGRNIQFHLWDTAGQEKYKSIAPIYYRQAKIALCVYDICSQHSFEVMKSWIDELKANGPEDCIIAIVGNKIDRYDDEEVNYADVKAYAEKVGAILKLVSAKEGKNINDLFVTVAEKAIGKANTAAGGAKVNNKKKQKKGTCC